ncbi:MAG: peptidylprolyl isomerase [Rhodothermales bacterium]
MRILLVALFVISSVWLGCKTEPVVPVTIHTSMGAIDVVIDTVAAPRTSANFLRYASEGFYDGGSFRRVVRMDNQPGDSIRIEAVQAWANMEFSDQFYDPIDLERTIETGLMHFDGTISMARNLNSPNSATHSFFFVVGDQHALDFGGMRNPDGQGFAAFGRVTEGMDVVRAIQAGDVDAQILIEPVIIDSVRVH